MENVKSDILKLRKELKAINNKDYTTNKKEKCNKQIDVLLNKRMIYALLAKTFNLKVIVLPNYKIVLVINKVGLMIHHLKKRFTKSLKRQNLQYLLILLRFDKTASQLTIVLQ